MKSHQSLVSLVFLASITFAQPPTIQWTRTYGCGNPQQEAIAFGKRNTGWKYSLAECRCLAQTLDGGFVLAGRKLISTASSPAFLTWIVRTDKNGDTVWTRSFDEKNYLLLGFDELVSVDVTADGGFIFAGTMEVQEPRTMPIGVGLVRVSASGDLLWAKERPSAIDVCAAADGGFVAVYRYGVGDYPFAVKTDANGNAIWRQTFPFNPKRLVSFKSIAQLNDGGFIVAGVQWNVRPKRSDFFVTKLGAAGDTLWSKSFGTDQNEACNSVIATSDGGFLLSGSTGLEVSYPTSAHSDILILKCNAQGDSLWSRVFGDQHGDTCLSISQTAEGDYVLIGIKPMFCEKGRYCGHGWLAKLEQVSGEVIWERLDPGILEEYCDMVVTSDGGLAVAGTQPFQDSAGSWRYEFRLQKLGGGQRYKETSKPVLPSPTTRPLSIIYIPEGGGIRSYYTEVQQDVDIADALLDPDGIYPELDPDILLAYEKLQGTRVVPTGELFREPSVGVLCARLEYKAEHILQKRTIHFQLWREPPPLRGGTVDINRPSDGVDYYWNSAHASALYLAMARKLEWSFALNNEVFATGYRWERDYLYSGRTGEWLLRLKEFFVSLPENYGFDPNNLYEPNQKEMAMVAALVSLLETELKVLSDHDSFLRARSKYDMARVPGLELDRHGTQVAVNEHSRQVRSYLEALVLSERGRR